MSKDLERELLAKVENWVSANFNYQNVNVFNTIADNSLFEFIRQSEVDAEDFINEFDLWDEYNYYLAENDIEDIEDSRQDFSKDHEHYQEYQDGLQEDNYPCWNTLFEFRNDISEETIEKCIEVGFGIIEGMDDFNTTLFVSGAGYSFYAQHWIPLWLSLEYTDSEKYTNINFSHL